MTYMPPSELWSKWKDREEIFIVIPYTKLEARLRIKLKKKQLSPKSKKKDIEIFSIGLEAFYNNDWDWVIKYCNYHEKVNNSYHIHNKFKIPLIGCSNTNKKYCVVLNNKKVQSAVFRYCLKQMKTYATYYLKNYYKIIK
jgi:hypothetical protein